MKQRNRPAPQNTSSPHKSSSNETAQTAKHVDFRSLTTDGIIHLQRTIGNQALQRLIQSGQVGLQSTTVQRQDDTPESATDAPVEEPPEIKERLDMIEKEYRKILMEARLGGYKVGADNMKHFLDGKGTPRTLKPQWLRKFSSVAEAEKTNQQRFENESKTKSFDYVAPKLADGEEVTITDYWDRLIAPGEWDRSQHKLYFASGHSTLTSRGEFTLKRTGNTVTVTGTVVHEWKDRYDWHENLVVNLPNGELASDKDALLLEKYRGAAPFDMNSEWTQQVQGTYTIIDIFPDSSSYEWTGP